MFYSATLVTKSSFASNGNDLLSDFTEIKKKIKNNHTKSSKKSDKTIYFLQTLRRRIYDSLTIALHFDVKKNDIQKRIF